MCVCVCVLFFTRSPVLHWVQNCGWGESKMGAAPPNLSCSLAKTNVSIIVLCSPHTPTRGRYRKLNLYIHSQSLWRTENWILTVSLEQSTTLFLYVHIHQLWHLQLFMETCRYDGNKPAGSTRITAHQSCACQCAVAMHLPTQTSSFPCEIKGATSQLALHIL